MSDQTDICNLALVKLGHQRISAITESSVDARLCNAIYDEILDEALSAGPEKGWKFARARITVSVDADSPNDQYDYRYKIPNECLRIVKVHTDGTNFTDWIRQGEYILTNQVDDEIDVEYVRRITVTGLYPPHFVKVVYMMLAYHLGFKVTQSKRHVNSLHDELYYKVLPEAIALDGQEQYVQEESSSWVDIGRTTTTFE
jgi:hypothetical protein